MNIAVTFSHQKKKNLKAVAKLIKGGVPFENAMGRVMRAQAKREGQKPTPVKKKNAGRPRELTVSEFDLLRRCPFQSTMEAAEEMGIPHNVLKGQSQALRNRRLVRNINAGQKHKNTRAVYEITEQGMTHLAEYESGKRVPREENKDVYADIMDALGDSPKSYAELAEATGRNLARLRNCVRILRLRGRVRQAYIRSRHRYYEKAE